MPNLSIRGLDEEAAHQLREEARKRGVSVNACVIDLLRRGLGIAPVTQRQVHNDLDALAGTWSEEEAAEFGKQLAAFEQVDEDLWR